MRTAENRRLVQAGGSVKTSRLGTLYLNGYGFRIKRCGGVTGQEYNVGWYRVNNAPAGFFRQGLFILNFIQMRSGGEKYEICKMV